MASRKYLNKEDTALFLLNEMANSVNFHKQKEKQRVSHIDKGCKEFVVDFVRDGRGLYYIFSGFGDLMGHYVYATSTKYRLAENRIGHNGDVSLFLSNPDEKKIFVVINSQPELSKYS
jgi:hypothetical protein